MISRQIDDKMRAEMFSKAKFLLALEKRRRKNSHPVSLNPMQNFGTLGQPLLGEK